MNGRHFTDVLLFTVQVLHVALNDVRLSTNEGRIKDKVDSVHERREYTGQLQAQAALSQEKYLVTIEYNIV